ncbi:MAG TPA: glucoamylase family protein, partial [Usitatibacter sp.]
LDAIARTAWRMLVTRRRLLEWSPSADDVAGPGGSAGRPELAASIRSMWIAPVIAVAAGGLLAAASPAALSQAAPFLVLWLVSPCVAWWISRPLTRRAARFSTDQALFLRSLARRTWGFFETMVGPDDHGLPPDNYQEHPAAKVAHRTSPTNMGLALLANLGAYDFGFIPAGQLILRTESAMAAMFSMERYQGHFYNWYDTQTLQPLQPLYVSSVDSGNLAGHLMTLRPGLLALIDDPIMGPRWFEGLSDTLRALAESLGPDGSVSLDALRRDLQEALDARPAALDAARRCLDRLDAGICAVAKRFSGEGSPDAAAGGDAAYWLDALARQCRTMRGELEHLASWSGIGAIPTLRELAALEAQSLPAGAAHPAAQRIAQVERLAQRCDELADMEYGFLYDAGRRLLAIGYNVGEHRRDSSYYDLLASEARLASFVAISQGKLPQENWFALGRLLTTAGGEAVLMSWSGSMFEYLMPLLVMPSYDGTLLDQTCRVTVERQIAYGEQRGVPWGISECGYNSVDSSLNYQYRAFGVPGLGLKRGLAEDLVVTPYASALALMVAPEEACVNLETLAADGLAGRHGLYEAIDYTAG